MTTVVRRLTPSAWEAWRLVRLRALAEDSAAFGSTYDREAAWSDEEWRTRTAALAPFVVEEDGRLVASAGLVTDAEGVPHLVAMWVDPETRRRGIGTSLLDAIVGVCRAAGHRVLRLGVTQNNHAARSLYCQHGFVETGRTTPLARDPRVIEHEMELKLR
ncbi:MAG: GNAT family N-acetyltransferase [Candidatus Dormibacteraeota bacterium]|nr:GNAT family N-acetyltransferase [Candidatus Dormibacteraeota bacterium]